MLKEATGDDQEMISLRCKIIYFVPSDSEITSG